MVNLRHAKRALERAKFAYDAEQGRASEAAIERCASADCSNAVSSMVIRFCDFWSCSFCAFARVRSICCFCSAWPITRDICIAAFADALRVNGALDWLQLNMNKIGDAGAAALADALRVNGALSRLKLVGNQIGEDAKSKLQEAVQERSGFQFLDGL